jgi:hypothetical protein
MGDATRVALVKSDIYDIKEVYKSATSIFSAFVSTKMITEENYDRMLAWSVKLAMELSKKTASAMAPREEERQF